MLQRTIYIISFFFVSSAQAQDTLLRLLDQNLAVTENREQAVFSADIYRKDKLWQAIIYYGSGNLAVKGSFKDKDLTVRHGWFTFYYSITERKMYEVHYDNGFQTETWRSWHENGRIRDSGRLDDAKKTGYWVTWHSNGKMAAEGTYKTDYEMDIYGLQGTFGVEKRRMRSLFLQQQPDMKTGLWRIWYRNGQIKDSTFYTQEGKEEGMSRSWYDNGNIESVGTYTQGRQNGRWEWYHPNGKPATIEQFVHGKINSMQCFDTTGTLSGDYCSLEKPALFPGGITAFEDYLKNNLRYPERANGLRGEVELEFIVGPGGKAISVDINSSPSNHFSQEAERLIYEMPVWDPAISHNRAVAFPVSVKLVFRPSK